jgi:hypothetical protein
VPQWNADRRARPAGRAPRPEGAACDYASVGVPLPFFFICLSLQGKAIQPGGFGGFDRRSDLKKLGLDCVAASAFCRHGNAAGRTHRDSGIACLYRCQG